MFKIPPSLGQLKATIETQQPEINTYFGSTKIYCQQNGIKKSYNIHHHLSPEPLLEQAIIIHRLRLGYRCSWEIAERIPRECKYCEITSEPLLQYLLTCPQLQIRPHQYTNIDIKNTAEAILVAQRLTKHLLESQSLDLNLCKPTTKINTLQQVNTYT